MALKALPWISLRVCLTIPMTAPWDGENTCICNVWSWQPLTMYRTSVYLQQGCLTISRWSVVVSRATVFYDAVLCRPGWQLRSCRCVATDVCRHVVVCCRPVELGSRSSVRRYRGIRQMIDAGRQERQRVRRHHCWSVAGKPVRCRH